MAQEVTVYSTPTCPYCNMAKKYFEEKKVNFHDFDVSMDAGARRAMVEKSGQMGVPVIDIDGTVIVGFDRPKIEAALGQK